LNFAPKLLKDYTEVFKGQTTALFVGSGGAVHRYTRTSRGMAWSVGIEFLFRVELRANEPQGDDGANTE
jgi:hypothetical protein